jgi:hypothetical protein
MCSAVISAKGVAETRSVKAMVVEKNYGSQKPQVQISSA